MLRRSFLSGLIVVGPLFSVSSTADGAAAVFSFQNLPSSATSFSNSVTDYTGFASAPTISVTGSSTGNNAGSPGSFLAYNGITYSGSGTGGSGGYSRGWGAGSTGNSFTIALNMTGLEGLNLRFDYRSAGSGTSPQPQTAFTSFQYSLNGGDTWENVGGADLSLSTWILNVDTIQWYSTSFDLSGLGAINGAANVRLKFDFGDLTSSPDTTFKIDNLQLTAVPEASAGLLAFMAAASFLARRRRM